MKKIVIDTTLQPSMLDQSTPVGRIVAPQASSEGAALRRRSLVIRERIRNGDLSVYRELADEARANGMEFTARLYEMKLKAKD